MATAPDIEHIQRLLEIYTLEEILELNDLPEEEAVELLVSYGALDLDRLP